MSEGVIPNGGPVADVPAELRALPQWVGWRRVGRKGKPTKEPINPRTGGLASTTNPDTWGTIDEALAGAVSGRWDGVGFVFTAGDPYCGIDLDEAVDLESGEADADALATIDRFATYAEFSPGGDGFHLILRGSPPGGVGRKRGDRECYDRGRFFTVTGRRATPHGVEDRQATLGEWHAETFPPTDQPPRAHAAARRPLDLTDQELLDRIGRSKQADKFGRLWAGDTTGYASGSEADLALCAMLMWWCNGDAARADRMFRGSGLMRPKWDARRGETTYGGKTLARGATGLDGGYDPDYRPPVVITTGEFTLPLPGDSDEKTNGEKVRWQFKWSSELSEEYDQTAWLWEGFIPEGGITLLSALWKAGKTTVLSLLLKAFGPGESGDFLGHPVRPAKVLYVTEEMERHWSRRRKELPLGDHCAFHIQPFPLKPTAAEWLAFLTHLLKDVAEHKFDLVVFDTLADLWPVVKENDAGEVQAALAPLRQFSKLGVAVLLVHHLRKSGGAGYTGSRGSGVLGSFPDIIVELNRSNEGTEEEDNRRYLKAKGRYEETPERVDFTWSKAAGLSVDQKPGKTGQPGNAAISSVNGRTITPRDIRVLNVLSDDPNEGMTAHAINETLRGPDKKSDGLGKKENHQAYLLQLQAAKLIAMDPEANGRLYYRTPAGRAVAMGQEVGSHGSHPGDSAGTVPGTDVQSDTRFPEPFPTHLQGGNRGNLSDDSPNNPDDGVVRVEAAGSGVEPTGHV